MPVHCEEISEVLLDFTRVEVFAILKSVDPIVGVATELARVETRPSLMSSTRAAWSATLLPRTWPRNCCVTGRRWRSGEAGAAAGGAG